MSVMQPAGVSAPVETFRLNVVTALLYAAAT
jgi:hypothetical protein